MGVKKIIDIHCHLIPAVDDGARDMKATLKMLMTAKEEGITHMIATPHHRMNRLSASGDTIHRKLEEVRKQAEDIRIPIELYAGNEIRYYSDMEDGLEQREILTLNESNFVLVEFSASDEYFYIRNSLDEVRGMGYCPILAHVERYDCMLKQSRYVEELHKMGVGIQVDSASVTGENGKLIMLFTHGILKKKLVDYVSTNAHTGEKKPPRMKKCSEMLYRKYDEEYVDKILFKNAEKNLIREEEALQWISLD